MSWYRARAQSQTLVVRLMKLRDANEFPWLKHFEENYKVIRDELLALREQKGFQPYRGPSWISEIKAKDGVGN